MSKKRTAGKDRACLCSCACRCSGRQPSAALLPLALTRPSPPPSDAQRSPALREQRTKGVQGRVRGKPQSVFTLRLFSYHWETTFSLRAGSAGSSASLYGQNPGARQPQSRCRWIQMESFQSGVSPCQGVRLPETDSQLALRAIPVVLTAQTSLFITVPILHKDLRLYKELHLNLVNPCNHLKYVLQVTRNRQTKPKKPQDWILTLFTLPRVATQVIRANQNQTSYSGMLHGIVHTSGK